MAIAFCDLDDGTDPVPTASLGKPVRRAVLLRGAAEDFGPQDWRPMRVPLTVAEPQDG
jgi:hypothetical protein